MLVAAFLRFRILLILGYAIYEFVNGVLWGSLVVVFHETIWAMFFYY